MATPRTDPHQPSGKNRSSRILRAFFLALTTVTVVLVCYSRLYSDARSSDFSKERLARIRQNLLNTLKKSVLSSSPKYRPVILLWTPYYSQTGKWLPSLSSLGCPVSDCIITDDRTLLDTSSAVVFHWRNVKVSDLPPKNNPDQKWVLFNKEAPPHTPSNILDSLSDKITWMATYRKDSDLHAPYGWIEKRKTPVQLSTPPSGRRPVCWLVSNCNTPSLRERFVEILKEFISIDVYGQCGDLKCPTEDRRGCYRELSRRCKFYLSFENSICKDYSTEKLFNALSTDMVPIVMGGEDYSKILPPNSYIDALSFEDPQRLAEYLWELDKNDSKYLSYLEWKKDYQVVDGSWKWSCELCHKLHLNDHGRLDGALHNWWYGAADCSPWNDLVKHNLLKKSRR